MNQQPAPQPQNLVLRSPADVAASVPYLLGFVPTNSVVILFFDDQLGHVSTSRIDFPDAAELAGVHLAVVADSARHAGGQGSDRAQVVLYPPPQLCATVSSAFIPPIEDVLRAAEIEILAFGAVFGGDWFDFDDPPGPSNPATLADAGSGAACQWVARGVSYLPDRATLADSVSGSPTTTRLRIAALLASAHSEQRWDHIWPPTSRAADRRAIEDAIYAYLMGGSCLESIDSDAVRGPRGYSEGFPSDAELVGWAIALNDRRIREPLLWRLSVGYPNKAPESIGSLARAQEAITALVRNVPDEIVAPLASCAAALAWQRGAGALAVLSAQRGLAADSRNVLCDLVLRAAEQGMHPKVWVEMLASMSLAELRAGRAPTYTPETHEIRNALREVRDCPG